MRTFLLAVLLAAIAMLPGCAQPGAAGDSPAAAASPAAPAAAAPRPRPLRAPPMSKPLPPERVGDGRVPAPSTACRTDSDCAVKDVGSCCGVNPACVNKDAAVDAAGVKARCEEEGRMSTCAFKPVESCSCVSGSCKANLMMTN